MPFETLPQPSSFWRGIRGRLLSQEGIADLLYALRSELLKPVEDFVEQNRRLPSQPRSSALAK